jgi:hypothetical protein
MWIALPNAQLAGRQAADVLKRQRTQYQRQRPGSSKQNQHPTIERHKNLTT